MTVTARPIWTGSTTAIYGTVLLTAPAVAAPLMLLYVLAVLLPLLHDFAPVGDRRRPVPFVPSPAAPVRPVRGRL